MKATSARCPGRRWRGIMHRQRGKVMRCWVAAGVVFAVLGWVSACGAAGPADLSEAQRPRLQARAVARAWQEWASSQTRVCASTEVSADLRAALSELFPAEIE